MTRSASRSLLSVSVLALGACSSEPPEEPTDTGNGAELYASAGCAMCHGADGAGGPLGPELRNLGTHWQAGELAEFLADPMPFVKQDARLAQQAAGYQMPMQPQPTLSLEDREAIAAWVLSL